MEHQFKAAAKGGRVEEVEALLRDHPGLDVNCEDDKIRWTALHFCSMYGNAEVVKLLLAHPAINVNAQTSDNFTPILICCWKGSMSVAQLLLKDPRVDVTLEDCRGCTPLWLASHHGHCEVIEWLIASGKDLGDLNQKVHWDGEEFSALEIAREHKESEVVSLLEKFMDNATQVRHGVRVKLGVREALAAEVFALTVFLCDDLFQASPCRTTRSRSHGYSAAAAAIRFFKVVAKFPMELQMILCHRAAGTTKDSILSKDSEAAFKSLAKMYK